jgi:hypothetical protein
LATWPEDIDNTEKCKRIIDLFLVSVLLDAGAGTEWSYKSPENGRVYRRSEGIAVASLDMFKTVRLCHGTTARAQSLNLADTSCRACFLATRTTNTK